MANQRHQQIGVVEKRFVHRLIDPVAACSMPQPECSIPCGRHQKAIDVEAEATEHRADVKMLDLFEGVGDTIPKATLNGSHDVIVPPDRSTWTG